MELTSFLKINPADSVIVCLQPLAAGTVIDVDGKSISLLQDTPAGHKVLINDVAEGQDIIKYGYPIGHAMRDLKAGEWVNEDNLKTNLSGKLEYTYSPVDEKLTIPAEGRTFKGYVRKNGDWVPFQMPEQTNVEGLSGTAVTLAELDGSATLEDVVAKVNEIIGILKDRGITTV